MWAIPRALCMGVQRAIVALGVLGAIADAGCGSRCAEVAARRSAVFARTEVAAGPHAEVLIPLARANALLASLVRDQPLRAKLALPSLGLALPIHELTAIARSVELQPSGADRVRFAVRVELADDDHPLATLGVVLEVVPRLVHTAEGSELVAGFDADSLVAVQPELTAASGHALADSVARWLPTMIRDRVPRSVLDHAAQQLGELLSGEAYPLLRQALLRQLGQLTQLRVQLPALPIARLTLPPTSDALTFDITTDLPVRHGLTASAAPSDEFVVRLSASTAVELVNWGIDRGYLPQHYTRDLAPKPDGEYRPRFDYVAEDRERPVKIHIFQELGGCSYYQVGMALDVDAADDHITIAERGRRVEASEAPALLEAALWLKQLVLGPVERSRRVAASTRLTFGNRTYVTRVAGARLTGDELTVALAVAPEPAPASPAHLTDPR